MFPRGESKCTLQVHELFLSFLCQDTGERETLIQQCFKAVAKRVNRGASLSNSKLRVLTEF